MPRPSLITVLNPYIPLILRFWKYGCLFFLVSILALVAFLYLLLVRPLQISYYHDLRYHRELEHFESREASWARWPKGTGPSLQAQTPAPRSQRPQRLVEDVPQLHFHNWRDSLNLYADGTGRWPRQDYWIYVGGTGRNESDGWLKEAWRDMAAATMPGSNCVDPPEMCSAFNDAFNALVEETHVSSERWPAFPLRRFVDCDHSPLVCDWLAVDANVLLHFETGRCRFRLGPYAGQRCDTKWSVVPLPLPRMPFQRSQTLPDGRVVPVFPSALEQLSSVIHHRGALEALEATGDVVPRWIRAPKVWDETSQIISWDYRDRYDDGEDDRFALRFATFDFLASVLVPSPSSCDDPAELH